MLLERILGTKHCALAPMAGVADRAMRELCREYGAAFVVGELASMGVQLFGNDPLIMARAAVRAMDFAPDFIDINMGCPAPKIAMNGGGSSLMRTPLLAAEIVRQVKAAVPVPVTCKIRSGWDASSINAVEMAQRCEDAGADMITVHGRTREQQYAPPADWEIIRFVKQSVQIPVIGNGDVTTPQAAQQMLQQTGCDGIMIGRAACGAPWIFTQIEQYLSDGTLLPPPSIEQRMNILLRQIRMMVEYKGEKIAFREARKHAAWYMRGIRGAAAFRRECGQISSYHDLEVLTQQVIHISHAYEQQSPPA